MSDVNPHKPLVRQIYDATATGDVALLDSVVTDDIIEHPLNPGQVRGRDSIKQTFGGLRSIVPDLRLTIEDMVTEGNKVAVRSTVRGTHGRAFLGSRRRAGR